MPWISGPKLTTSWNATGDRQWGTLIGEEYAHTKFSYCFYFHPLHPNINRKKIDANHSWDQRVNPKRG